MYICPYDMKCVNHFFKSSIFCANSLYGFSSIRVYKLIEGLSWLTLGQMGQTELSVSYAGSYHIQSIYMGVIEKQYRNQ